jgi:hypothetical protein
MFERINTVTQTVTGLAASGTATFQFHFPRKVRLKGFWAVSSAAQAAHASQVLSVTLTNRGTNGSGTTDIAVITNNSGQADSPDAPARLSGPWAAYVGRRIDFEQRPTFTPTTRDDRNTAIEVPAGNTFTVTISKAAGTATGDVAVGIDYVESD